MSEHEHERLPTAVASRTSESEEMFLITISRAIENGHEPPIPLPLLADELEISRVSANEMAKKLVARGFVEYEPYHGVVLTAEGSGVANSVLRRRRLWALFLAEHLGLSPAEADDVACEFEHVTPGAVSHRLADFLGDPRLDPEGRPIPAAASTTPVGPAERAVLDLEVGRRCRVVRVAGDSAMRSFLLDEGMTTGVEISLLAIGSDGGCLVTTPDGRVHLSRDVAASVVVSPLPEA